MCEELTHALLVALLLKVHISHKTLWLSIAIRALQQHAQVPQCAHIAIADVNDETRVSLLLDRDLAGFFSGHDHDAWLRDIDSLVVQIGRDHDRRVLLDAVDRVCYRLPDLDLLILVVRRRRLCILVHNDVLSLHHDLTLLDRTSVVEARSSNTAMVHAGIAHQVQLVGADAATPLD